jgi:lysophospholipase
MLLPSHPFTPQYWTAPDGLRLRYAWFSATAPVRGTLLLLQGRREFIEKYSELTSEWRARGFHVAVIDLRGQGGSGRLVANSHKSHVRSFDDYRNDIKGFYEQVVSLSQQGPLVVYGHSMGGCIALDWLLQEKVPVKAAVLVAPMLVLPVPVWLSDATHFVAKTAAGLGYAESYIPGEHDYKPHQHPFENNVLTHDPQRYAVITTWFAERPELAIGGVTYGWLDASLRAIESVRQRLPRIGFPTLVLNGGMDRVLPLPEMSRWARVIPNVVEKIYPGSRHDIMGEIDAIRDQAWRDIDTFLTQAGL